MNDLQLGAGRVASGDIFGLEGMKARTPARVDKNRDAGIAICIKIDIRSTALRWLDRSGACRYLYRLFDIVGQQYTGEGSEMADVCRHLLANTRCRCRKG